MNAWRGLSRSDRLVLGLVLLLVAACFGVPRALYLVHPEADNLARFRAFLDETGDFFPSSTHWAWEDQRGEALPAWPLGRCGVAVAGGDLPRDRWGEPWRLIVDQERPGPLGGLFNPRVSYFSAGPDRRFEGGQGDDLLVCPRASGVEFRLAWFPLLWLAGLIAFPYLSGRMALLPRSRSTRAELVRATAMAVAPVACVWLLLRDAIEETATDRLTWVLVSPGTAALLTTSLFAWGACLANRLVRPVPDEPAEGP